MNEFEIRVLAPKDWALYKSVRLESLRDSPDSFGSTYEQEVALSDDEWQTRLDLKLRALDALPLVAKTDGMPVGLAWGLVHNPNLEVAHIYQMWVSPQVRGKGIAKALLNRITAWADAKGCESLALAVTTANDAAVGLYRSAGFEPSGEVAELREGSVLRTQPMVKALRNAA